MPETAMTRHSILLLAGTLLLAAACDRGPNGYGTAPPGISQADWDAQQEARRQAKYKASQQPNPGGAGG